MKTEDADWYGIVLLRERLNRMPQALVKELRPVLRKAADPIVSQARSNASWSTRIPGAISARVAFAGKNAGVTIRVNHTKAPHARPYEGLVARARDTRRAGFRHPVFSAGGSSRHDTWVNQPFRPFLLPAVDMHRERVLDDVAALVDRTLAIHAYKA